MKSWWKNSVWRVNLVKSSNSFVNIYDWCNIEIGPDEYYVTIGYPRGSRDFYFKHEEDKVKFILRWL